MNEKTAYIIKPYRKEGRRVRPRGPENDILPRRLLARFKTRCEELELERVLLMHRGRLGDPAATQRLQEIYHLRFVPVQSVLAGDGMT